MLRDLTEYDKGIREEMKALLREIKKNPQETNSEGKKAGVKIKDLEHKEEINSQSVQSQEIRIIKHKKRIRRLWDISKSATIQIIGMPEGEEEEQEIENLLKIK